MGHGRCRVRIHVSELSNLRMNIGLGLGLGLGSKGFQGGHGHRKDIYDVCYSFGV